MFTKKSGFGERELAWQPDFKGGSSIHQTDQSGADSGAFENHGVVRPGCLYRSAADSMVLPLAGVKRLIN